MSGNFNSIFQNNAGYVEEMFARYSLDPNSVGIEWRAYFEGFNEGFGTASAMAKDASHFQDLLKNVSEYTPDHSNARTSETASSDSLAFEMKAAEFVHAWKSNGHLQANTNPLPIPPKKYPILALESYGLTANDLKRSTHAGALIGLGSMSLEKLILELERRFAGTVGAEIEHVDSDEERRWLHAEFSKIYNPIAKETQKAIYSELAKADSLEKTIATKYIGKKRFSIEGADAQYPAVETFIDESTKLGVKECTVAIAHRGRLNFLVNVIGKPLQKLFAEWEGYHHDGLHGDCDVKYHYGYESERKSRSGNDISVSMPFNPSHLEYVDSIVMGDTRARQVMYYKGDSSKVASIVLHGDAAFSGQGIVFETVQMMSLKGYNIGGTVHLVANNQVGFTTDPSDSRSSTYCTDVAKVTGSPIFHINADNLDSLHNLMVLAANYRAKFKKDIYIDLICFRRYGHNEADEPVFTQPLLYKLIKDKPSPFEEYSKYLSSAHGFLENELKAIYDNFRAEMNSIYDNVKSNHAKIEQFTPLREAGELKLASEKDILKPVKTQISLNKIKSLAQKISTVPESFRINPKLSRIIVAERKDMAEGKKKVDWGMAELLAYASLLEEGFSIRLAGEDAQRGTFSHRHVTLIDSEDASHYTLLSPCTTDNSQVEVINTLLSEEAAMGYEYGYAVRQAKGLVLWEGQFGDFANGAQVIIDQFIASGETKWCQTQGLVLLLPHGMEGQGAEHSSARLERFLQLCADGNMQVCYFTNAAQIYHALRRQMLRNFRKPLILMTPKSFLRSPRASTTLEELATGHFEEILDDLRIGKSTKVDRVLFCTGKISLDLFDALEKDEFKNKAETTAVIRIEQLYPFHIDKAVSILSQYKSAKTVAWVQEEPANMGAWSFIRHELENVIKKSGFSHQLEYFGRRRRATPAVGIEKWHFVEQEKVIKSALESNSSVEV
ncbi:2-oxoglutarate dehydrogenase E1 component [Fluviispira multicolorata]|uniref:oxoglutarate dehydrogenase (succinyl-transferring) n=1 Tax=Fluviispira multicolorata TaxID=2654512 RepID=A0A833N3C4_9BACT|nr:2-oxoglutarate dehydrogenase E1 component [Fluviispira multicolorata]KAB8033728.1 2-oxoglutarate dehydrogenase E1 component [Fluviispira multicolorata]